MKSNRRVKLCVQGSNRSKGREILLIEKEIWRKEKKKCSLEEIDWYIMWEWFNTVANEELVSLNHKILLFSYPS